MTAIKCVEKNVSIKLDQKWKNMSYPVLSWYLKSLYCDCKCTFIFCQQRGTEHRTKAIKL